MRFSLASLTVLLMACSAPSEDVAACPADRLSPAQVCLPEACGLHEVRVDGVCQQVGNRVCAEGFVAGADGGCVATLPESCADPLVAFPGDSTCHELDECPTGRYPTVDGPAIHVDGSAAPSGDGSVDSPVRTIAAGLALARDRKVPRVLVAAGTYAESVVIDSALELRGVCTARVRLTPPLSAATQTTISATADATVSGLTLIGPSYRRAFGALGGASLALERVSVRGYLVGVEIARVATPKVPQLRVDSLNVVDAQIAIDSSIPFQLNRVFVHGVTDAVRLQADGVVRASVIEDGKGGGITVSGGRVQVERTVIRRMAASEYGSTGMMIEKTADASAGELDVSSCVLSEIAGEALSASGAKLVVRETSLWNGVGVPDNHLSAGIVARQGAQLEARDVTIVRPQFSGVMALGAAATIESTMVRDVSNPTFGAGLTLFWGSDDAPQLVRRVFVSRALGAGVYVYGGKVSVSDVRIVDALEDGSGSYGDGIDVLRGTRDGSLAPARLDASRVTIERAHRAAIGVFGAELHLEASRLCGAFDLDATKDGVDGVEGPFDVEDGGNNACGCGAPLKDCRISQSSLKPLPPPL